MTAREAAEFLAWSVALTLFALGLLGGWFLA